MVLTQLIQSSKANVLHVPLINQWGPSLTILEPQDHVFCHGTCIPECGSS